MARSTSGKLYRRGKKGVYYFRFQVNGKIYNQRLLDSMGRPVVDKQTAVKISMQILAPIKSREKADFYRVLQSEVSYHENAEKDAKRTLANSESTLQNGFKIFMQSHNRPKSCKGKFSSEDIPVHSTASNYKVYYSQFQKFILDNYPKAVMLSEVNPEVAENYINYIRQSFSPGTINKHISFLKMFYRVLIQSGKLACDNPFRFIELEDKFVESKRPMSIEQIASLFQSAEGELRVIIALGYFTGLRLGDCATLKWSDIDLIRAVIERLPNKTRRKAEVVKIGIPPTLIDILIAYSENMVGYVLPKCAELYNSHRDNYITRALRKLYLTNGIIIYKDGTGPGTGKRAVVEIGFHSLRYSYISHNAERGIPAAIIQKNAGHSNPAMTEHYTRISDTGVVNYARMMDDEKSFISKDLRQLVFTEKTPRQRLIELINALPDEKVDELLNLLE